MLYHNTMFYHNTKIISNILRKRTIRNNYLCKFNDLNKYFKREIAKGLINERLLIIMSIKVNTILSLSKFVSNRRKFWNATVSRKLL